MNRTRKYLIIILILFTALLCAVGASTWIVTTPTLFTPKWEAGKKAIYVKRVTEDEYNEKGIKVSTWNNNLESNPDWEKKIKFCDADGGEIETSIKADLRKVSLSDGANSLSTSGTLTEGGTYLVSDITITLNDPSYYIAGTYLDTKNLEPLPSGSDNGFIKRDPDSDDKYTLTNFLYKYKTVKVGDNYYTIEDALAQKDNATVKGNTSFARPKVASIAGYSTDKGNYTVSEGETLLLPYSAEDKTGNQYLATQDNPTLNTSYTPKKYLTLTVPSGIELSNVGTITVGAVTGANNTSTPPVGGISAGFSEIALHGTINSSGTLNVYGNISGSEGKINATKGTVRERMEILDWPGGRSAAGHFVGNKTVSAFSFVGQGYTESDPNEFPFEQYQLQAINGPVLNVSDETKYLGNVRIYTGEVATSVGTLPPRLSIIDLTIVTPNGGNSKDGLFRLKSGSSFSKQVVGGREKITITGGTDVGVATINMVIGKVMIVGELKVNMDSSKVKFPVPSCVDIVFDGGDTELPYGYELMGESAKHGSGATITIMNRATVTLKNKDDGIIGYAGSKITVGANSTLTVEGTFGADVMGEEKAQIVLDDSATLSASGCIGGTGNVTIDGTNCQCSFIGTPTTANAKGQLTSGFGNFEAGKTYMYLNDKWVDCSETFDVEYKFKLQDKDGALTDLSSEAVVPNNPTSYTCLDEWTLKGATSEGYTFFGWYTSENCTGTPVSSFSGKNYVGGATLYGLFKKADAYVITFKTAYPDGNENIVIGSETVLGNLIEKYDPVKYNQTIQKYDEDPAVKYYFGGWYVDSSYTKEYNYVNFIDVNGVADGSVPATVYAKWIEKAYVTIEDKPNIDDWTQSGYYKPGQIAEPTGHDPAAKDYDVTVSTYFSGTWTMAGGSGTFTPSSGAYTVAEGDTTVTITADRENKVTLTVNVTGQSKITLTASNVSSGLPDNTTVSNKTYYLIPGTEVTYTITSSATNGLGKATWSWSITGAAEGDDAGEGDGPMQSVSGFFTMPASDQTVTVSASSENGCIVEGTLITLADGTQKPVEEVKAGDEILVFNHETGKYEKSTLWIMLHANLERDMYRIVNLRFSNGSTVRIVDSHGFFDRTLGRYVFITENNVADFIGHEFSSVEMNGRTFVDGKATLISAHVTEEEVKIYSPISTKHMNIVAEGILTTTPITGLSEGLYNAFAYDDDMKFNEAAMQADIEKYGLYTYEDFKDLIPYEIFKAAPWDRLKVAVGKGLITWEDILWNVRYLFQNGFVG